MKINYIKPKKKERYQTNKVVNIFGVRKPIHIGHEFFKTLKKQTEINVYTILPKYIECIELKTHDLVAVFNFVYNRHRINSLCSQKKAKSVYVEVGFFPHYGSYFFDPLGFCWESSLTKMTFTTCSNKQRKKAEEIRKLHRVIKTDLPDTIKKPYFLWPAQTIRDGVNRYGLNCRSWVKLISHFRRCLPEDIQLVIKVHPRSDWKQNKPLYTLQKTLNNVLVVNRLDLQILLSNCIGVAGANSTVLYESRLIYNKPTYTYAKSWFTGHEDLFFPIDVKLPPKEIQVFKTSIDYKEYTDWFLYQLIVRQILRSGCKDGKMVNKMIHLSSSNFKKYGEDIFL